MALDGPTSNEALYLKIFQTKDTAAKQSMMKALSSTQKQEYLKYLQLAKTALAVKESEAKIATLDEREAALRAEDRTILHQASSSYAPKVGAVQPPTPTSSSTPKYGSKFSQ